MDSAACPGLDQLREFNRGKLPLEILEKLAPHIESCASCQEFLSSLVAEHGSLFERLREIARRVAQANAVAQGTDVVLADAARRTPGQGTSQPAAISDVPRPASDVESRVEDDATPSPVPPRRKEVSPTSLQSPAKAASHPKRLGQYELLEEIGRGGMGVVYKARHARMDRFVALKVLPHTAAARPDLVERFRREVRAAARLIHPNVVVAHDADEADGTHFLVMEFVDGRDLSMLIKKQGPLTVERAIQFLMQAAQGLAAAHAEGIVHRDIKPGNLLVDDKDTVKILDMGLAHLDVPLGEDGAGEQDELTASGMIMGTVDYMSPEQAFDSRRADARADIYSLGCTLYYLLSGAPPYREDTRMAKLLARREHPIPALRDLRDGVPEVVDSVLAKMLAKKPEERYQTMTELISDLQRCPGGSITLGPVASSDSTIESSLKFLQDFSSRALRSTSADKGAVSGAPTSRWRKRLRWGAGIIGLAVLIAVAVVIVGLGRNPDALHTDDSGDSASNDRRGQVPKILSAPWNEPGAAPSLAVAPFNAGQAHAHQEAWAKHLGTTVETINSTGMGMVLIPPGEFLMGSTDEQIEAALKVAEEIQADQYVRDRIRDTERPQHRVVLDQPFWMGSTEVTIGQFRKFIEATQYVTQAEKFGFGNSHVTTPDDKVTPAMQGMTWRTPGYHVTDDWPVSQVTWNDAVAYCNWLSGEEQLKPCYRQDAKDGWVLAPATRGYRLPTEAEWEYACRAGTMGQYWFGDDATELEGYGWYNKNSGGSARAVGLKPANGFGLHDTHGNVYEWCNDWCDGEWYEKSPSDDSTGPTSGSSRVIRGGYWNNGASLCRSAYRGNYAPTARTYSYGCRVVRTLDLPAKAVVGAPPAALERDIAAWILRKGGKVFIHQSGGPVEITSQDRLPDRPFQILTINLNQVKGWTAADFDRIAQLVHLRNLFLWGTEGVTDATLQQLQPLVNLETLYLGSTKITAAGLEHLRGMRNLVRLDLQETEIADGDLVRLKEFENLTRLGLMYTKVTDAGLTHLREMRQLIELDLRATDCTVGGIAAIQQALPDCKVKGRPAVAVAPFEPATARRHQTLWSKYLGVPIQANDSLRMTMTLIPPGEFLMGSTPAEIEAAAKMAETISEPDRKRPISSEAPQHPVAITKPLLVSATEVTVGQFKRFVAAANYQTEAERLGGGMRYDADSQKSVPDPTRSWREPGEPVTEDSAVTQITWNDAVAFCVWASAQEKLDKPYEVAPDGSCSPLAGNGYRLPTEAQWEYACRAGTKSRFSCGNDGTGLAAVAWYNTNAKGQTQLVAKRTPNPFQLYDMHGNADEWCQDWYDAAWYEKSPPIDPEGPASGLGRVRRSGNRFASAQRCRSAARDYSDPTFRNVAIGFRVVRVLELPPKAKGD